jgi:hypothetical protein
MRMRIRIRIQGAKSIQIHADPDPSHLKVYISAFWKQGNKKHTEGLQHFLKQGIMIIYEFLSVSLLLDQDQGS